MIDRFFKFISISGFSRDDILNMSNDDYVRVSKQLKLSQKKHGLDLSTMSKVNEAFKDHLDVLKFIYNEDLIYYTFTKNYRLADKADFFYLDDETIRRISDFIEMFLMQDLEDEFKHYVFKNDYRQLNHWMSIANIFPQELKPKIMDALMDKLDLAIEVYKREKADWKLKVKLKFLKDPDFINCLNLEKSVEIEEKIDCLFGLIVSRHNGKYSLFTINVCNALIRVHYLNYDLKYKMRRVLNSEAKESINDQAAVWGIKFGLFASVLIIVYMMTTSSQNGKEQKAPIENAIIKRTVIDEKSYLNKLFSSVNEPCSNNCELALRYNNVKVFRTKQGDLAPLSVCPHDLVTNRPATLGLDGEIANQMTGKDICFINQTAHPVLIVIVSKYTLSTIDYKFFYKADSGFSVGRYFVDSGDTLTFDHRADYFKIQTGSDLRKFLYETKLDGNPYKGTAYGFCTVSKQDIQLLKMNFNVIEKRKAIKGSFILKQNDDDYKFNWKGKDNCISVPNSSSFFKSNQTLSLKDLIQ